MIRSLSFFRELVSFLREWAEFRRTRRARPSIAQLKLEYAKARKAHRGQRAAQARLQAAVHRRLAAELGK
jgi:hypothetical protein